MTPIEYVITAEEYDRALKLEYRIAREQALEEAARVALRYTEDDTCVELAVRDQIAAAIRARITKPADDTAT